MKKLSISNLIKNLVTIPFVLMSMVLVSLIFSTEINAYTIEVVDDSGMPISGGFRWLIEEDTTVPVIPGNPVSDSLSLTIHRSYSPIVQTGEESSASSINVDLPVGRYMVSIMPLSPTDAPTYTLSGANFTVGSSPMSSMSRVTVHSQPVPTSRISIFVFHDYLPLNGEPDLPEEEGMAGFSVLLFDIFGQQMMDAFGNPLGTTYIQSGDEWIMDHMGTGIILTDGNGEAMIQNIAAGKYGVRVIPPLGTKWVQTNTIEGTPGIDAWVRAGEPALMLEGWGPGFYHCFFGFTQPTDRLAELPNPTGNFGTITGRFINNHLSKPPQIVSYPGAPVKEAWIGLNLVSTGESYYVAPCDADGAFNIPGVPPGAYQIAFFDTPLDGIFDFANVIVPEGGGWVEMGDVPVFDWFGSIEGQVFYDSNANGFPDSGEPGMSNQAVNLRFRDGSMYQATITDINGDYSFVEIFPFFKWLVMEVDYLRFKPTGATFVVDDGGPVPSHDGWNVPSFDKLNPQAQAEINPNTGNNLSRTETGGVLTEGFILQAGEPNMAWFGKEAYGPAENGGISGIVRYATTRAEDDPRYSAAEDWEPGIPRVQVNLYLDTDNDLMIDDLNGSGDIDLADTDNYPFSNFPGPEDTDNHPGNPDFDPGDALTISSTDAWDDNMPTGCIEDPLVIHGEQVQECIDNFRTWNQIRPAVFDGGYAFFEHPDGGYLSPGYYIVEAVPPPGYEIVKEEDKNVDFGDSYEPSPSLAIPPACVGDPVMFGINPLVPDELTLFPGVPCAEAGQPRKLCNLKQILLRTGENTACDFFFFTKVPKSALAVGLVLNDLGATFGPNDPMQGEKPAPSWIPISIQDYMGHEVVRTYCDEFGAYNALVPSTFTANVPAPSGMSPNMLTIINNDPGPIPDPNNPGEFITDPWFDPRYGQASNTRDFLPGKVTYLDTPLLPVGSFRDTLRSTDCAFDDGTPVIRTVSGPGAGGPYVTGPGTLVTITSMGFQEVPNPDYNPTGDVQFSMPKIRRDYTFGPPVTGQSRVTVGGMPLINLEWAADGRTIRGEVPAGMQTGDVVVTRGDNHRSSVLGVTLHIGLPPGATVHRVSPGTPNAIQTAIDNAGPEDLILVAPGYYTENLIISKKVRLQGWGAGVTVIDASPLMDPTLQLAWKSKIQDLMAGGWAEIVPGQDPLDPFSTVIAPGILVFPADGTFTPGNHAMIDGLTVQGAPLGGGILVNGYADYLEISNNIITGNFGDNGGGIIIGTPSLEDPSCPDFCGSSNDWLSIHNNQITNNTGLFGAGGIAVFNGTNDLLVENNEICGNLSQMTGGGIGQYGYGEDNSYIGNRVLFNEVFYGGNANGDGGGIFIGGETPAAGGLTPGSGSARILSNLIQGNSTGSGWGGGIRLLNVNGLDVAGSPDNPDGWHEIQIFNNMIVNNLAAYAGGGIALQDAARVKIINNTLAANDSTATSINAMAGGFNPSIPQPAGLVSAVHSPVLTAALGSGSGPEFSDFSNPVLINTIIYSNRSFYYDPSFNNGWGGVIQNPALPVWDMAIIGTPEQRSFSPQFCVLSDPSGYAPGNIAGSADLFVQPYLNTYATAAVGPEGGNSVIVAPIPLTASRSNYHLRPQISPAIDSGTGGIISMYTDLQRDYDRDIRNSSGVDIGADEVNGLAAYPEFIGVFRSGTWYLDANGNGNWDGQVSDIRYTSFGLNLDLPVAGDWNAMGYSAIGTYRTYMWYLDWNGNGQWQPFNDRAYLFIPFLTEKEALRFGLDARTIERESLIGDAAVEIETSLKSMLSAESVLGYLETATLELDQVFLDRSDTPVVGDWSGNGRSKIGIFRDGMWFLDYNGNGKWDGPGIDQVYLSFGQANDQPVTGDWNGNGSVDIGVFRNGAWYLDLNNNGLYEPGIDRYARMGRMNDKPVTGDWSGLGRTLIGVKRVNKWLLDYNGNNSWDGSTSDRQYTFLRANDLPVVGRW